MIYKKLIIVKVYNCVLNGRKNQNTQFFFSPMKFGFNLGDEITDKWILTNLNLLKKDIYPQNNTKIKIL